MNHIKNLLLSFGLFTATGGSAQYASGDNTSAAEFDAILKTADRASRDFMNLPSSFSLKQYAPVPQNQGQLGTCVAWSGAYAARTISYGIQREMLHADSIKKYAFSAGYLYYKIKEPGDTGCMKGATILNAMKVMTANGAMLKKEGPGDCATLIPDSAEQQKASPYKIKDFLAINKTFDSITKNDIIKIKKSLTEKKPVLISLKIYESFEKVGSTGIWSPPADDVKLPTSHAMCITGYDDKIAGGAFEVMNSWGTKWGNKGYCWLSYKQVMKEGIYAIELMDFEPGKTILSGSMDFIKLNSSGADIPLTVARKKITVGNMVVPVKEKADYSLYQLTQTLKTGDQFKMKFSTNSKSYIYVFAEDNKKVISPLFPPDPSISAAINSINATYYFPSDTTHARLDNTIGKENFCILYSKSEIDFNGLINYINESHVSIFQGVKDKLSARLLDLKRVKFRDDKIFFQAPADDKSVLCFFVEMKHN
ncbi:MAG: C1 family peptidase [Bacteroidota bacterium]|nr:C1 family peptidase [Bacteroidota bacterium]